MSDLYAKSKIVMLYGSVEINGYPLESLDKRFRHDDGSSPLLWKLLDSFHQANNRSAAMLEIQDADIVVGVVGSPFPSVLEDEEHSGEIDPDRAVLDMLLHSEKRRLQGHLRNTAMISPIEQNINLLDGTEFLEGPKELANHVNMLQPALSLPVIFFIREDSFNVHQVIYSVVGNLIETRHRTRFYNYK